MAARHFGCPGNPGHDRTVTRFSRGTHDWTRRGSLLALAGLAAGATTVAAADTRAADGRVPVAGTRGMYLIGDSWAAGLHADPANALGQVAARAIGWPITVDAVSGTGYLNDAGAATYPQRAVGPAGTERLVVVQGGSNDDDQDLSALPAAVTATVQALRHRFADARILLLGPGPDPAPVTDRQRLVDDAIGAVAATTGVAYISMLDERWIPERRLAAIIDPTNQHPTLSGQQYLGLRLAATLHLLFADEFAA